MALVRDIIACIAALTLGTTTLYAQLPSRAEIEQAVNPSLSVVAKRGVRAEKSTIDLGEVEQHGLRKVRFTLRNISATKVAITEFRSTCSCLKVQTMPTTLGANEQLEVVATFNPAGRSGKLKLDILVYTSLDAKSPTERLTITGTMASASSHSHLPYSVGEVKLSRKSIVMEGVKEGATRHERIVVANTSSKEIRLSAHSTIEGLTLRCEPATLKPGEEGQLIVSYTARRQITNTLETMLIMEGCSGRPTERAIKITITK